MCTCPWILTTSNGFVKFVQVVSSFLGPIATVMITDYYILRKKKLDLDMLYDENGPFKGVNWQGIAATLAGAAVSLIFIDLSWIAGIIPSVLVYLLLTKYRPLSKEFLAGTIYEK
ncbi:cytosine permease [Clostridium sp. AM58-1XD]|uniref:cytosine permease n=1 Tax=Clostridium sp. AM58-1XD TaxID=2292307 RepID=UPI001A9A6C71|nr:cytosine permease [Clostridium sp. AM58-1XD]